MPKGAVCPLRQSPADHLARTTLIGRRRLSILNTTGRSTPHPEPCGQSSDRL